MKLRDYQQESLTALYNWWMLHPDGSPILVMPTGAGKSVVIAELTRLLFDTWPEEHPRTLVIVPSKELAEQNADKLLRMLPAHLDIGYYSASVGQKRPDADVIVATIGSIARNAHILGNIKCVIVDECHLINPDGPGQYRAFLRDLAKYCKFRVVGLTATPFRGNGVWLTDGKDPLFTGIAHEVKMQTLMDAGHLAPFVRPVDIATRIDTGGISINKSTGDYNAGELADRVSAYLPSAASDACRIAADRKKWLAFTPTVRNADELALLLMAQGISTRIVTGETPKKDREQYIAQFHAGEIRCLVTVLALATGFDVPDVDCILWLRPTISPVLYIQGAGRGLRPSPGKEDCLWLDFSDTTERMGPIDAIRGRKKGKGKQDAQAPFAICGNCGAQVRPASALECPECGEPLREPEDAKSREVSNAAVMLSQLKASKIVTYPVHNVTYAIHKKEGSPDSLRVEYWSGMRIVAREWVCFDHTGFARAKAEAWLVRRAACGSSRCCANGGPEGAYPDDTYSCQANARYDYCFAAGLFLCDFDTETAFNHIDNTKYPFKEPSAITVNEAGKYPEIVRFDFSQPSTKILLANSTNVSVAIA